MGEIAYGGSAGGKKSSMRRSGGQTYDGPIILLVLALPLALHLLLRDRRGGGGLGHIVVGRFCTP